MALIRFGNFAVEWMRVFALQRIAPELADGTGEQLLVFVDDPGMPAGRPLAPPISEPAQINAAWRQATGDRRFAVFGTTALGRIALDKAKVCAVTCNPEDKQGRVSFDLGQGRGATVALIADLATSILSTVPEPKYATEKSDTAGYDLR
jgi:hypothetical protein